ncbi:MAG: hypothetical protein IJ404_02645 [Clostridia bacterium]|nr:hypothetical protein [Clostridia bacterium]MBQ8893180.1 hypothetical protein [Clostridia bacterium]
MVPSQKEKLLQYQGKYLNFGITEGGEPRNAIGVPWEATAHAFNMRTPDVYLAPEDLADEELMSQLRDFRILGCYIFTPLEDYSFLAGFPTLQDIHIRSGSAIRDLFFLKDLEDLFMFYLEDANLKSLEHLFTAGGFHSYCLGLCNCKVAELTPPPHRISELVILQPEGTGERERWKALSALKYYYYEYKGGNHHG